MHALGKTRTKICRVRAHDGIFYSVTMINLKEFFFAGFSMVCSTLKCDPETLRLIINGLGQGIDYDIRRGKTSGVGCAKRG